MQEKERKRYEDKERERGKERAFHVSIFLLRQKRNSWASLKKRIWPFDAATLTGFIAIVAIRDV